MTTAVSVDWYRRWRDGGWLDIREPSAESCRSGDIVAYLTCACMAIHMSTQMSIHMTTQFPFVSFLPCLFALHRQSLCPRHAHACTHTCTHECTVRMLARQVIGLRCRLSVPSRGLCSACSKCRAVALQSTVVRCGVVRCGAVRCGAPLLFTVWLRAR